MAAKSNVHPAKSPRQKTLRRRINNYSIYRTIRKAIRDCEVQGPVLLAPSGYGWFFERFQKDNIPFEGIELDHQTVLHARTAITPEPKITEASILEMPFKDGEFDFIVNNRFLLHFEDDFRAKSLLELARVTRRYLLVHYDTFSIRQLLRKLRGTQKEIRKVDEIEGWRKTQRKNRKLLFNRKQMEIEGAAAGFRVKKLYYVFPMLSDRVYCLYEKVK